MRIFITGLVVSVLLAPRSRHGSAEFAGSCIEKRRSRSRHGINVVAEDQIQRSGAGLYKHVDVDHEIVLPKKGEAVV